MTLHLNPPFRADHIGSLKRPQALLQKRAEFDEKKCTREDLRVLEDQAIKDIVQMQREAGIRSFTDGEFRRYVRTTSALIVSSFRHLFSRHMFYDGVFDNMEGMKYVSDGIVE